MSCKKIHRGSGKKPRILRFFRILEAWLFGPKNMSKKVHILSDSDTLAQTRDSKRSLVRFGDGEINLMQPSGVCVFQCASKELRSLLLEAIHDKDPRILLCLSRNLVEQKHLLSYSKYFWIVYRRIHWNEIRSLIDPEYIYGNASVTLPYNERKDKNQAKRIIEDFKQIWAKKRVLLVEGTDSMIGVGNDLFEDALAVRRIICPSENAFSKKDEILKSILKNADKSDLILLSLGPTATVLTYILAKKDIWAIDIGHLDSEYKRLLSSIGCAIKQEYAKNECEYKREIISVISAD